MAPVLGDDPATPAAPRNVHLGPPRAATGLVCGADGTG